ncbi:hypothetical protein JMUB3933_1949 [Leptotrichia wadei]|uniref:SSAP RNA binding domain-containing protein n=1 Tax=Leptotrichia wadei TaxID=157687 RepID=A0A510KEW1_9FUSO|nr:DUF1071 domain-containing protein [Leptotrichia wadei]BBM48433.1 hypothetical protein JMUB3933_1949 [Leptotrichia wadei]
MNIKDLKTFEDRYNYDVKKLGMVEKKGKFDYLSWAYAQKLAKIFDEKCTWRIIKNDNGSFVHNGFLLLEMTFLGQTEQHFFPIIDHYNKPIQNPNPYQINTSQMRGFAKLFAMVSGFGLSLYVGEDLAYLDEEKNNQKQQQAKAKKDLTEEEKVKIATNLISKMTSKYQKTIDDFFKIHEVDNINKLNNKEILSLYSKIKELEKKGA